MNLGRFDEAIREFETAVQSPYAPETAHAQLVRMKAHRMAMSGAAVDEWRKLEQLAYTAAAKFAPVSSDAIVLRAEVAAAQNKFGDAIKFLRQETGAAPATPDSGRPWPESPRTPSAPPPVSSSSMKGRHRPATVRKFASARAALYAREPGRFRSIDKLAQGIDSWAEADQLRLLYGLVEVYDRAGNDAKVVETLRRIASHRPTDASLLFRLHARAIAIKETVVAQEARAALVKIEGEKGDSVLLCDAAVHSDTECMERLRVRFGESPTNAEACLALARWKDQGGDTPEAMRLAERAYLLEPTRYETTRAWLIALWKHGSEDDAKKFLTQLAIDSRWASGPFRRLLGGVLPQLPEGTAHAVVAWCQPFVQREPGGLGWLAECYTAVGQPKNAEAALAAAVRLPTVTADDWFRMAISQAQAGNKAAAGETLQAAREKLSPRVFYALAAAFLETPAGTNWLPATPEASDKRLFAQSRLAVKLSRSARTEAAAVLESYVAEANLPKADAGWGAAKSRDDLFHRRQRRGSCLRLDAP